MSPATKRPVVLLTGASGTLGTALIASLRSRADIAAVRFRRPLAAGSHLESLIDPRNPRPRKRADGDPPFEIVADFSSDHAIDRVVELALARFGTVDVLINAAGKPAVGDLISTRVIDGAGQTFRMNAVLPVKLAGALTDACWRHDESANRAANRNIVNVSALASLDVPAARRIGVFAAAKSALNMLTCQLAADLEHLHVRVNAVAPAAFPQVISTQRVVDAVVGLVDGEETGRIVAMWPEEDELI